MIRKLQTWRKDFEEILQSVEDNMFQPRQLDRPIVEILLDLHNCILAFFQRSLTILKESYFSFALKLEFHGIHESKTRAHQATEKCFTSH